MSLVGILTSGLAIGSAVASCASDDENQNGLTDADAEATASSDDAGALDGPGDAVSRDDAALQRDAATFDGGPLPVVCASTPCAVALVRATSSAGEEAYCALLDDHTVACWGAGRYLGRGTDDFMDMLDSAKAKRVRALSDVARLYPSCAIDQSGGLWCWGSGPFLTQDSAWRWSTRVPMKLPLPPAKSVAIGGYVGCALVDDGDVLCWGRNTGGLIAPLSVAPSTARLLPQRVALPAGAPVRELRVGEAVFAVREDGVTVSWGASPLLGRISSIEPDLTPLPIPLEGIASFDLTPNGACATVSGVGYCWGSANVALSPPFVRMVPEPVATPEPVVQIATSPSVDYVTSNGDRYARPQRWCAVGASGDVYCWGYNAGGQAGDGTKNHAYQAVKVQGLPEGAASVSVFPDSTCALLTTGKVHCWGTNAYGQLGNGRMGEPSLVPQEVVLP